MAKRVRGEADRRADKVYYEKHKPIYASIVYKTEEDKPEGIRLQNYLASNNISANAYIKSVIKADLDSKNFFDYESKEEQE